jgi:hypothetical protein
MRPLITSARDRKRVERLLRQRLTKLMEAVADGQPPDADALQEVERLQRLIELQSTVRSRRWRFGVVAATCAFALVIGVMLRRVDSVNVEGTVRASSIRMTVAGAPVVVVDQPLRELASAGFITINGLPSGPPKTLPNSLFAQRLPQGTITLQQTSFPRGSRLELRYGDTGGVSLRVEGGEGLGRVEASMTAPVRMIIGQDTSNLEGTSDALLGLGFRGERFDLSFSTVDTATELFRAIDVDSLLFSEVQTSVDGARINVIDLSTITGGELILPELDGRKIVLHAREHLHLNPRSLRIHRLRVEPEGLLLDFQARTSELAVGVGSARRDLRPSCLELYAASRSLEIARTAVVSVVVLLLAVLAMWLRGI